MFFFGKEKKKEKNKKNFRNEKRRVEKIFDTLSFSSKCIEKKTLVLLTF